MKFAKIIFWCAGAWGVLILTPMYFLYAKIGEYNPPPTHAEFYYGFVSVALAWQIAFFVIATDPARFRAMIVPSAIEKLSYVVTVLVLYLQRHLNAGQLLFGGADLVLGLLFVIALFKLRPSPLPNSVKQTEVGGEG